MCVFTHVHSHVCSAKEARIGCLLDVRALEAAVTGSWELPCGAWELNSSPLEEWKVL